MAGTKMDWTYLLISLEGRINRKPYWIVTIILIVVSVVLQFVALEIGGKILGLLVSAAFLYPAFALNVKRAHDRNRPTWMIGAFYAVLVLMLLLQLFGLDMNGTEPTALFLIVAAIFGIAAIGLFIDLGLLRGTRGPNDFGDDPLEGQA
jgi:uncharacterized membrane protein YhaH (DUF805 family)